MDHKGYFIGYSRSNGSSNCSEIGRSQEKKAAMFAVVKVLQFVKRERVDYMCEYRMSGRTGDV